VPFRLWMNLGMGGGGRASSLAIPIHDDETVMHGAPGSVRSLIDMQIAK
jgi:hypothetical protein